MSKRIKNWTTDNTRYEQMFHLTTTNNLIELNNKLCSDINVLRKQIEEDFGDIWSEPEDYDEQDRKEYSALCKQEDAARAKLKKLHFHLSGLAEMLSEYSKERNTPK